MYIIFDLQIEGFMVQLLSLHEIDMVTCVQVPCEALFFLRSNTIVKDINSSNFPLAIGT